MLNIQKKLLFTCSANMAPEAIDSAMTTGSTPSESTTGAMMPAAVIAPTDTDPMAKCRTAAISHASRMLTMIGAPSSAENRSSSVLSMPLSAMTAPRDPPTPVTSRISPVVWKPAVSTGRPVGAE